MLSLRDYAEIEIASGAPDAVLVEATEVDDARHWIGVFESPTRGLLLCLSRRVDSKTGSAGSTDIGDVTAICPPRLCAAAGRMPTGAIDAQVTGTPEPKLTRVSPSTWALALGRELPIDISVQPTDAEVARGGCRDASRCQRAECCLSVPVLGVNLGSDRR